MIIITVIHRTARLYKITENLLCIKYSIIPLLLLFMLLSYYFYIRYIFDFN